jgi:AraC-like DNA-binding protein
MPSRNSAGPPSVQISPIRHLGTAGQKPKDRLGAWIDYTQAHSTALIMPSTPVHDYRVKAVIRQHGAVTIQKAQLDPLGFARTPKHVAKERSDRVRISYCAKVDGGIESGGRSARIGDGAVYFRDYAGTGSFWSHAPITETWLFVPRDWLTDDQAVARHFDGAVFQSDAFLAGLMAERIEAVAAYADDSSGAGFEVATDRLRATIEDIFAAQVHDSHRQKLLQRAERLRRIKAHMARHASDAELTPDRIADALGIGRATLYRLLREEGLQVNAHVAEYRLTAIARMLHDPAWTGISIAEIAGQWGHLDAAYFARAFKRHFGQTPTAYRACGPDDTPRLYL